MLRTFFLILCIYCSYTISLQAQCTEEDVKARDTTMYWAFIDSNFQKVVLDVKPEYLDGGEKGFHQNLRTTIKYPAMAKEYHIKGKLLYCYEINELGMVENVQLINTGHKLLQEESERVIQVIFAGKAYQPAIYKGKPVRVKQYLPINYKLE